MDRKITDLEVQLRSAARWELAHDLEPEMIELLSIHILNWALGIILTFTMYLWTRIFCFLGAVEEVSSFFLDEDQCTSL